MSPPMIALHGFTGRAEAWAEVTPHATGLALVGHAPEVPVPPGWTFEREVDRIAALLLARWPAPVHLAGYSMGGRVALAVACRVPQRVARLTLVAAHPGLSDAAAAAERRDADEKWCALLEEHGIAAFVAAWQEQPMWRTQRALADAARERQRLSRLAHAPDQLAAALRALGLGAMASRWAQLPSLSMPVDWVAGDADEKYADLARRAAARCPRGRAIVIAGAGHNVLLERPEPLARALAEVA
jgi:2-succinyl-6-hydroxy-2,4-cyclohexadiene-1-carboxylate synthase